MSSATETDTATIETSVLQESLSKALGVVHGAVPARTTDSRDWRALRDDAMQFARQYMGGLP